MLCSCEGVGLVGWIGVGVFLLVVSVGVGLVGFMLFGVVFGFFVWCEESFWFVVGRIILGLEVILFFLFVVRVRDNNRLLVLCDWSILIKGIK